MPGYYTECALIARQARELGLDVPLLGGDGWDSPKTIEIGGEAVEGVYITNHYSPEDQRPEVQKFVADYKAKYGGKTPDAIAVLGYDAMQADGRRHPPRRLDRRRRRSATRWPRPRTSPASAAPSPSTPSATRARRSSSSRSSDGKFHFVESIAPDAG